MRIPRTEQVADSETTLAAVQHFNELFNRQDLAGLMALLGDDSVFENTYPPPDGARHVGQAAIGRAFADFFHASPQARFESEEIFATGDRCVVRWIYRWTDEGNNRGHVRGVDLFRVREGKIAEKFSYVKG
ncbi:MAG: nuclear transport factor 2 family protein [Caldilineaceae bacterium]|nr:nuclear transport factor 2 family protein [Caldilineaceae bacterium]